MDLIQIICDVMACRTIGYLSKPVWSISSPWVRWDYLSGEQSLKCRMGVVNSAIEYELRNPI
ncbi:hypothetical protein T03_1280 [Trichinella britovi]|uniref:Uncharacterized protein n=1 Tax=Trichinella britovi TaxID=45882 RepID=A0A0V1C7L8_TRIBR|nr:hypothetical protein T03_1280 [Trichinella britovi]KRZ88114.1 hypothetical protein T08_7595 [Trichinella sp. T8]